ncbi:MAG TPA: ABC transporter permease [Acidobacteriaceae bacterium]|jgi:predicted permease
MRWLERIRLRLRGLLFRHAEGERLRAEMQFHLDALISENIAAGMSPDEARCAAMRAFGNTTVANEQTQATWGWMWLERLAQDIRFALRQIRRAPGFAVVAILTLALGIGANNAVFTLTHALLLQGLPIPDPNRLVRLSLDLRGANPADGADAPLNLPLIQAIGRRAHSFSGVFGWCVYDFVPPRGEGRDEIRGAIVSGNAFQVLGVRPAAGRLLTPADDQPGGGPDGWAGVISYREWVQRYHANPSVIGRQITITDQSVTIVGVAPAGFEGVLVAEHPDMYLPLEFDATLNNATHDGEAALHSAERLWLIAFARLRPGISRVQAAAEMSAIFPSLKDEVIPARFRHEPAIEKAKMAVDPGRTGWSELRLQYTQPLMLLQVLVAVVLLICCANLSGLFLARASARQQEFAIRAALGAARPRLMRQLLIESLMLALPGSVIGIVLAWAAGPWIVHSLGSPQAAISLSSRPDLAVLSVTAICAVLCALLFGMAPAWTASHTNVEAAMRSCSSRMASGNAGARRFFIPFQVALSLALVVVAGLLGSTVVRLRTDRSGYRTENVSFYIADFNRIPQKDAELIPLYRRVVARMEEMPGVESASVVEIPPLLGWDFGGQFVALDDIQHAQPSRAGINSIGADFFTTVGTRLVAGRDLHNDDADLHSCILNQTAAQRYFPHTRAIGKMLRQVPWRMSDSQTAYDCEVVGIVQDTKYDTLAESYPPIVYSPLSIRTGRLPGLFFVAHARNQSAADTAYRTAIHENVPTAPESDPVLFTDVFNDSIARQQLLSALSGFFAALGLLLSGIGIYGLVAWNVTQRTREIGVRMALGATRMRVFALVMRQVAVLLAVGVVVGGVAALFAARAIRSFLFEVQPGNLAVFAMAAVALLLIGLLAAMLPARRAVSIDPMRALRTE